MAKSLLLVDANIISHALTPSQTAEYADLFRELEKTYLFVVTGFTKYELLCSSDKSHREKIDEYIEQEMTLITLSQPLMDFAARLCYLYGHHQSTKHQKIGMGDVVNGALSIIKQCDLITMDNNDYPRPFFQELTPRKRITYNTGKNKEATDTAYILTPDMDNIKQCFKTLGI